LSIIPLKLIDAQEIIFILSLLLQEYTLIIMSSDIATVTSTVLLFYSYLKPLIWPHVFCPLLPANLEEILSAPIHMFLGVELNTKNTNIIQNFIKD
jgi:hypothetical protein